MPRPVRIDELQAARSRATTSSSGSGTGTGEVGVRDATRGAAGVTTTSGGVVARAARSGRLRLDHALDGSVALVLPAGSQHLVLEEAAAPDGAAHGPEAATAGGAGGELPGSGGSGAGRRRRHRAVQLTAVASEHLLEAEELALFDTEQLDVLEERIRLAREQRARAMSVADVGREARAWAERTADTEGLDSERTTLSRQGWTAALTVGRTLALVPRWIHHRPGQSGRRKVLATAAAVMLALATGSASEGWKSRPDLDSHSRNLWALWTGVHTVAVKAQQGADALSWVHLGVPKPVEELLEGAVATTERLRGEVVGESVRRQQQRERIERARAARAGQAARESVQTGLPADHWSTRPARAGVEGVAGAVLHLPASQATVSAAPEPGAGRSSGGRGRSSLERALERTTMAIAAETSTTGLILPGDTAACGDSVGTRRVPAPDPAHPGQAPTGRELLRGGSNPRARRRRQGAVASSI